MLSRLRRLGSLTLLVALMGAGLGLPLFDAVVFHGRPLPAARKTISSDGAPQSHTRLCILDQAGLLTPAIGSAGHQTPAIVPGSAVTLPATDVFSSHNPLLLPRPRAPPLA